ESWTAQSPSYARRLGYPNPDFDLVSYAVRNLGHARVTQRGDAAHVLLRPASVSAATLAGVFLTLCDGQPRRVALTRHADDGSTHHEILASAQTAFWRMEDLVFSAPNSTWPRFVAEEIDPRHLAPGVVGKMLALIHVWQLVAGLWRPALIECFAD